MDKKCQTLITWLDCDTELKTVRAIFCEIHHGLPNNLNLILYTVRQSITFLQDVNYYSFHCTQSFRTYSTYMYLYVNVSAIAGTILGH